MTARRLLAVGADLALGDLEDVESEVSEDGGVILLDRLAARIGGVRRI